MNNFYYPAIRRGNVVLVCPKVIDKNMAIGPEISGIGPGYWYHYHARSCSDAHCWYYI